MARIDAAAVLARAGIPVDRVTDVLPRVDPARERVWVAPRWFSALWMRNIVGITVPWGIYVTQEIAARIAAGTDPVRDARLIAHELVHLEQSRRHGLLRHGPRYLLGYLQNRLRGMGHWEAYRQVPAEVEARAAAAYIVGDIR